MNTAQRRQIFRVNGTKIQHIINRHNIKYWVADGCSHLSGAAGGRALSQSNGWARMGGRAHVPAVHMHTEALAGRGETCRQMSAASAASGDRVLASKLWEEPRQCRCWCGSRAGRCTQCTWVGRGPCRCWRTGTACCCCWTWWERSHSHTARLARTPSSSDRTCALWTSPTVQFHTNARTGTFTLLIHCVSKKLHP